MRLTEALQGKHPKLEGCSHPSLPPRFKYHVLTKANLETGWQEWQCVVNPSLHVGYVDCVLPEEGWEIVNIRAHGELLKAAFKKSKG